MEVLEPNTAFHKNRDRGFEITELSYRSSQQDYMYINIKLYIHNYLE